MVKSMIIWCYYQDPCFMVQGMIIFSKPVHYGTKYDVIIRTLHYGTRYDHIFKVCPLWCKVWVIIGTWIYITIAISWEYPNKLEGVAWGCNTISPNDSANFLLFLVQVLQSTVERLILSVSIGITPFNSPDGNPMTDVSAFSKVLNYIGKYFIL